MRPRRRRARNRPNLLATLGLAAFAAAPALGQGPAAPPLIPPPPVPTHVHFHQRGGPLSRAAQHVSYTVHDQLIGDPALFDVPPLGYALYQTMYAQKAKADLHVFTLYRSDFVAGTDLLSPNGAWRLSFLASRLPGWTGPIVVEWTPDDPPLAEARRAAVAASLRTANLPVDGRVVIGPSPYIGLLGADAANNYDTLIIRDLGAPRAYSLTPSSTATFGGGGR